MPAPHVYDNIDINFARGVKDGVLEGKENDLVQQIVHNALADDANSSLPPRSDSGIGELLQKIAMPAPLSMTTITTSSEHVPVVTNSVSGLPGQPGV